MIGTGRAVRLIGAFAALAALTAGISACSGGDEAMVTGTVMKLDRSALPPDAVVTVELADVSKADAPADVLSTHIIELSGSQLPVSYELAYNEGDIDDRFTYAVSAKIESGGSLLYRNDTSIPVITRDNPTDGVEILVVPVG